MSKPYASNPAIALWLQSWRPASRVAGSVGRYARYMGNRIILLSCLMAVAIVSGCITPPPAEGLQFRRIR